MIKFPLFAFAGALLLLMGYGLVKFLGRLFRKVPPDRRLVFFSGGAKRSVRRITHSGMVFVPPWSDVGSLYLGAVSFELEPAASPLNLPQGPPLRFMVGADTQGRGLSLAAEWLTDLQPSEILTLARSLTLPQLQGVKPGSPTDRAQVEKSLHENIRMALAAKGLQLFSLNLDGLFADPATTAANPLPTGPAGGEKSRSV